MRTGNSANGGEMTAVMKLGILLHILRWKRLRGGVTRCKAREAHNGVHMRSSAGLSAASCSRSAITACHCGTCWAPSVSFSDNLHPGHVLPCYRNVTDTPLFLSPSARTYKCTAVQACCTFERYSAPTRLCKHAHCLALSTNLVWSSSCWQLSVYNKCKQRKCQPYSCTV